jgi:phosphoribosyl-ATP pyrophosphohydrolase/phosphoribosyl-AMP cyclohydrolase
MSDATLSMTDRRIRTVDDLDAILFEEGSGLVPVIAQDVATGTVLMLAYANREAVRATLESGKLHFWSRSRKELWRKGATSGNTLSLVSLHTDCDGDTLLATVTAMGPVCHTGETTCFGASAGPTVSRLDRTIAERAAARPEGSYTVRLLEDANLRLKKLGEETAELVAALATGDRTRAVEETADLVYHALVALRAEGVGIDAVLVALAERAD